MKIRHIAMAAGLVIATWLALFGDKSPSMEISEPVLRSSDPPAFPTVENLVPTKKIENGLVILALHPRENLIGGAQAEKQHDGLFGSQTWAPPPPPPPPPPAPLPPPTPTAPPLPFTYLGKKLEDGSWEVYLARKDQTFVVKTNTVIEGNYRIDAIKPPTLSLTYLPLNQIQTLTIGGTD